MTINVGAVTTPVLNKYKTVPALLDALEAQSGFREAHSVWEQAGELLTDLLRKRDALPPVLDNDAIISSGTVPNDWLTTVTSAQSERDDIARGIEAAQALRARAEYRLEAIATEPHSILSTLGERMNDVLARIGHAVADLGTASTPVEAIEQGTADAWRELSAARDEYLALRTAQERVMITSAGEAWQQARAGKRAEDNRVSYAIIRNLDEVFPRFAFLEETPWPDEDTEFLIWCVRQGAELWLPTPGELSDYVTERRNYFYRETQALAERARRDIGGVVAEVQAGNVHPHVQLRLRDLGVL